MIVRYAFFPKSNLAVEARLDGYHTVYESFEELRENIADHRDCFSFIYNNKTLYYVNFTDSNGVHKKFLFTDKDTFKEDWKNAEEGDWIKTTDNGVALILRAYIIRNKRYPEHNQPFIKLLTGNFNANPKYNYECTCKRSRSVATARSTNAKQQLGFVFKRKHGYFVENFLYTLMSGVQPEEAKMECFKRYFSFKEKMYNVSPWYRTIIHRKIDYILRHPKALEIVNKLMAGKQTKTQILDKYNLSFDKLVSKTTNIIDNASPSSPALVAALRFGKELIDEAAIEEEKKRVQKELSGENNTTFAIEEHIPNAEVIDDQKILPENTETQPLYINNAEESNLDERPSTVFVTGIRKKTKIFIPNS